MLLLAGGYVAWYGWYELRLAAGRRDALRDPVIRVASEVQHALADALDAVGPPVLLAALVLLTALGAWMRRRGRGADPAPVERTG